MSLGACLPGLVEDGKLSAEQAADARALYDDLIDQYSRTGSPEAAEALASQKVLDALVRNVTRKEFLAGRTIKVRSRIAENFGRYQSEGGLGGKKGFGGGGPIDPRSGPGHLDHDPRAEFSNVEGRRKAIIGQAHRTMADLLAKFSANMLGRVRNKALLRNVEDELFGAKTGDSSAGEFASAWRQTAEMLRQRRNAAGGNTGFRADWGLPQSHSAKKVRAAGYEAWRAGIIDRLAPERMIDQRTGLPFTRETLEAALPEVFETIRSNGVNKLTPGAPAGKALANQRTEARFFVFKDAQAWREYNDLFGEGTSYDAMMGHIESMAREIAALEVLGPNPDATIRWIQGTILKSAEMDRAPDTKAVELATAQNKKMDDLWREYSGANMEARNENVALVFSGYRSLAVARKLGSALISAVSDFGFQMSRRSMNGLSNKMMIPQYLRLMRPFSLEDQKLAIRRGLIAEEMGSRTSAQNRYLVSELTGEIPRRLAEGVLRASGLSRHTQMSRWGYGMETLAAYTENAARSFDTLEPRMREALRRYGIDAGDWDIFRAAPMDMDRGVDWISPHNLKDQELASRFMEMILEETDISTPVSDLATRAIVGKAERGTLLGETIKSGLLFKGFGISVMIRQINEIMALRGPGAAGAGMATAGILAAQYTAKLLIATTVLGALAIQLRQMATGKDPLPMADDNFWTAAMAQGGGFGMASEFVSSLGENFGNPLADWAAGPLAGDVVSLYRTATADDPRTRLVREAKSWVPGNNIWYSRLAFDRLVADQIEQAINPEYDRAWRRMDNRAQEQGGGLWWAPGQTAPGRAPDFANAFEEGPPE